MTGPQPPANVREVVERHLLTLPKKIQLAVALIAEDATLFVGAERTGAGVRYLDNRFAVFEIGSITKVFTAALLAHAVQRGAVELDTTVQELLPFRLKEPRRDGVNITLKHLANHSAGIRHHQPPFLLWRSILRGQPRQPFRDYSEECLRHYFQRQMSLASTPGERYHYSNLGMSLLGYVLSTVTERTYEELLQRTLFRPLGMSLSGTHVSDLREHVVRGWERAGLRSPNWDMYALSPAGGIKTCASDFAAFVRIQFSRDPAVTLTQTPTIKVGDQPADVRVGLGWHMTKRPNGETVLNHGGGMLGYSAHVLVNTARRYGSLVLSNLGPYQKWPVRVSELNRDLLQRQTDGSQPYRGG